MGGENYTQNADHFDSLKGPKQKVEGNPPSDENEPTSVREQRETMHEIRELLESDRPDPGDTCVIAEAMQKLDAKARAGREQNSPYALTLIRPNWMPTCVGLWSLVLTAIGLISVLPIAVLKPSSGSTWNWFGNCCAWLLLEAVGVQEISSQLLVSGLRTWRTLPHKFWRLGV